MRTRYRLRTKLSNPKYGNRLEVRKDDSIKHPPLPIEELLKKARTR